MFCGERIYIYISNGAACSVIIDLYNTSKKSYKIFMNILVRILNEKKYEDASAQGTLFRNIGWNLLLFKKFACDTNT
jgi:hypothetical protein